MKNFKPDPNVFTEIGLDTDSNADWIGASTEFEDSSTGEEYRQPGFAKMKFRGIYLKLWIFKTVLNISTNHGFRLKRKHQNRLKILLGISGEKIKPIKKSKKSK